MITNCFQYIDLLRCGTVFCESLNVFCIGRCGIYSNTTAPNCMSFCPRKLGNWFWLGDWSTTLEDIEALSYKTNIIHLYHWALIYRKCCDDEERMKRTYYLPIHIPITYTHAWTPWGRWLLWEGIFYAKRLRWHKNTRMLRNCGATTVGLEDVIIMMIVLYFCFLGTK